MIRKPQIPLFVTILLLVDLLLGVVYLANYTVGEPFWKVTRLLDLDDELSIANWYSSIKLFCISALGGLFAYHNIDSENPTSWVLLGLPLLFLLLSMDEAVQIHEWVGGKTDSLLADGDRQASLFPRTGIWMFIVGIPFIVLFCLWASSIKKYLSRPPEVFRKFVVGMIILLSGALGIEVFSNFFADAKSLGYILEVSLEEVLEMIGGTVILWSMYDLTIGAITYSYRSVNVTGAQDRDSVIQD